MANQYHDSGNSELISWIVVVAALAFFWPVGLLLLFRKLVGADHRSGAATRHPYDVARDNAQFGAAEGAQPGGEKAHHQYHYDNTGRYEANMEEKRKHREEKYSEAAYEAKYEAKMEEKRKHWEEKYGEGQKQAPGMQGVAAERPRYRYERRPVSPEKGKSMMVWGGILTGVFGFAALSAIPLLTMEEGFLLALTTTAPVLGFLGAGLMLLFFGNQRRKRSKRFRKYLALIGKRESISLTSLAQAMPVDFHTACDDLQEMLDEKYIPAGYLDMASGRLILSDEGLSEDSPAPEYQPVYEPEAETVEDTTFLDEITQINDAIADPEMSRKIDRIREITGKILDYQRKNPNRSGQLRSFLSYYLPTTLKILRAYAQMEAQGIEGENIRAAKARIEGMMDKVVEGFEKQLDKLFQDDAMDITTDVEVLERMLDKDGLSDSGNTLQMGG